MLKGHENLSGLAVFFLTKRSALTSLNTYGITIRINLILQFSILFNRDLQTKNCTKISEKP